MVTRDIRELIRDYARDDETVDQTINRLLDTVHEHMSTNIVNERSSVNINIKRDTMTRIKSFRIRDNESYGNILLRALVLVKDLDEG